MELKTKDLYLEVCSNSRRENIKSQRLESLVLRLGSNSSKGTLRKLSETSLRMSWFMEMQEQRGWMTMNLTWYWHKFCRCSGQVNGTSQPVRQSFQSKNAECGVKWKFNLPAAPHFGGACMILVVHMIIAIQVTVFEESCVLGGFLC